MTTNTPHLLVADDGDHGAELWLSDGTAAGTRLLKDIRPGRDSAAIGEVTRLDDGHYVFTANDGEHGAELWISNGTEAGTRLLRDIRPGAEGGAPSGLASDGAGRVYFTADDGAGGRELWVTDGTEGGSYRLRDIRAGEGGSSIRELTSMGDGRMLFRADDGVRGAELWVTDGTRAGTQCMADLTPGGGGSMPRRLTSLGSGLAVFEATVSGVDGLWVTDGRASGTYRLGEVVEELASGGDGSVWFSRRDSSGELVLWHWSAGDGSAREMQRWPAEAKLAELTALGDGRVMFRAGESYSESSSNVLGEVTTTHRTDSELWISDGTESGTRRVADLLPGPVGSMPERFTPLGNGLIAFVARQGSTLEMVEGYWGDNYQYLAVPVNSAVWVTDGTEAGTRLLSSLPEGIAPESLRAAGNGAAVFRAGTGWWLTDGTTEGTRMYMDLAPVAGVNGTAGGFPLMPGEGDPAGLPVDASPEPEAATPLPVYQGNGDAELLSGGDGNDFFEASGGDDSLEGGAGLDTARYAGNAGDYRISRDATGGWRVRDLAGTTGEDRLRDIEILHFVDREWRLIPPVAEAVSRGADGWFPETTVLPNGNVVRIYAVPDKDPEYWGYDIRRPDGQVVHPLTPLDDPGEPARIPCKAVTRADGGFTILTSDHTGIKIHSFDAAGVATGPAQRLMSLSNFESYMYYTTRPDLTLLRDGTLLAAWGEQSSGNMGEGYPVGFRIFVRHLDATGNPLGAAVQVNSGVGGYLYGAEDPAPRVLELSDGRVMVSWKQLDVEVDSVGAEGVILQPGVPGTAASFRIDPPPNRYSSSGMRDVAALADGGFMMVYSDGDHLLAQRYSSGGERIGEAFTLASNGSSFFDMQYPLHLAALADGTLVLAAGLSDGTAVCGFTADGRILWRDHLAGAPAALSATPDGGVLLSLENGLERRYDANGLPVGGDPGAPVLQGSDLGDVFDLTGDAATLTVRGGMGNDTYRLDRPVTGIEEWAGGGEDTVIADFGFILPAGVENLQLTGSADLTVVGNAGGNRLEGNAGRNLMRGGGGDDTYRIDQGQDRVREEAGQGVDWVEASLSWTLGANLENLLLTGSSDAVGVGNGQDNILTGNTGDNRLKGNGGRDRFAGGAGDDTYLVDSADDVVTELADGGSDVVWATSDYTLSSGLERLVLLEGYGGVSATGNGGDNVLVGNSAGNVLSGGGGDDRLTGRSGADRYVYARGDGQDVILDEGGPGGGADVLDFSVDIAPAQLWFSRRGHDLVIGVIGTDEGVMVRRWYAAEGNRIEEIHAGGGHVLTADHVEQLVTAMAALRPPAAGQTELSARQHAALDAVIAAAWS